VISPGVYYLPPQSDASQRAVSAVAEPATEDKSEPETFAFGIEFSPRTRGAARRASLATSTRLSSES